MLSKGLVMFIICLIYIIKFLGDSFVFCFCVKDDDPKFICNQSVFMIVFKDLKKISNLKKLYPLPIALCQPPLRVSKGERFFYFCHA